jgi:hypothetical protein
MKALMYYRKQETRTQNAYIKLCFLNCLLAPHLDRNRYLVQDIEVHTPLLEADNDHIKTLKLLLVPVLISQSGNLGNSGLFDQGVGEGDIYGKLLKLLGELQTRRVDKMVLSSLKAHTDNKDSLAELDTRITTLGLAGTTELIDDLLSLSGRALVHLVGAGLEKRELTVGEEVVGVNRDTVTTNTETGSVGHVTEGLGGSSARHLEGINAKTLASVGHLVGIGNAHHTLAVLVELAHLSNFRLRDRDNTVKDTSIETDNSVEGSGNDIIKARHNLGDGSHGRLNSARVNALVPVSISHSM